MLLGNTIIANLFIAIDFSMQLGLTEVVCVVYTSKDCKTIV